jgi:hypothetical protein
LLADRAALEVEPGEAQHEGLGRLRGRGGRRRLGQEGAALGELDRAVAVGQQAEVADADEAVGDDMEQEAAKELGDVELNNLHAVAIGVVAPAEADAAVGEGDEALIGERDTVGVLPYGLGSEAVRAGPRGRPAAAAGARLTAGFGG